MSLRLRKVITASAIGTLDWCAAQYLAEQQAFIRSAPSPAMTIGRIADEVVSAVCEAVRQGEPKRPSTIEAALKTALAGERMSDPVRAAIRMHAYALGDASFDYDITASQVDMRCDIGNGWELRGKADAVADGAVIIDWKATAKGWTKRKAQDRQYQVMLYGVLARASNWDPSGGVFVVSSLEPKGVGIYPVVVDKLATDGALALARSRAEYVEKMWQTDRFPRRGGCMNCPLAAVGGCPETVGDAFEIKGRQP